MFTVHLASPSPGVHAKHMTELRVFLLVCGLRRVKDPLYLVEDFSGKSKSLSLDMICRYITHTQKHKTVEKMSSYRQGRALMLL